MCGIVGAVAKRDVVSLLVDGLRRLEYRGYDSAGVAVISQGKIQRVRAQGKVSRLESALKDSPIKGCIGMAHTRWATHGVPSERNAHPHVVNNRVVLVHNGIIENYQTLKADLVEKGYHFESDTDSEIVAACIAEVLENGASLFAAVQQTIARLEGAYALCVVDVQNPQHLIGVRCGPPLAIGLGESENFFTSDVLALQRSADRFQYLEDGDIAEISEETVRITDSQGNPVNREICEHRLQQDTIDKDGHRHYMLKEIFEQPKAIRDTLNGRLHKGLVLEPSFGTRAAEIFRRVQHVQIIACGTSYYAGMVGRLWLESIANVPAQVEIASEFRYRKRTVLPNTLLVCISQSGETADTLAAMRNVKREDYCGVLSICNVPNSSLVRESELVFLTQAGPEIGVCSTKAFTTQLVALFMLTMVLGRYTGLQPEQEKHLLGQLVQTASEIQGCLTSVELIKELANVFMNKSHALFLGRGLQFPIAQEGALKLKEISYIHAEAYPAGELKHGPLALVDETMPVVVIAPNDALLEKLKSNIEEVRARGGQVIVFTPRSTNMVSQPGLRVLEIPETTDVLSPITYVVPLQLLAYFVAVLKGTDVDQPRNLAKSVTVE